MSLDYYFGDFDFSSYGDDSSSSIDYFDEFAAPSSSIDYFDEFAAPPFSSVDYYDSSEGSYFAPVGPESDYEAFFGTGGADVGQVAEDDRSYAQIIKEGLFETLGVGAETAAAISRFAKAANRGGGKQGQAQGRGRTGPALPSSARAPTTAAGRTSRARQATSGERAVQAAIQQSERATSAARAIANQMARAGTVTSTNDLADMISGSTKPMGTKQKLPGSNLRQLAIPRTQMA